jgi:ribonuclease III
MESNKLEEILGYKFKNVSLLKEALSHPSLHGNSSFMGKDYERLEFLGDAVVNLLVTETLYSKYKDSEEGDLAKMRAYLISKDFMVKIAKMIGLGQYMVLGGSEEAAGGRDKPNNLENMLESVIGAIYLDGGIEPIRKIVSKLWDDFITEDIILISDPKSTLQELLQEKGMQPPVYKVIEKTGQPHAPLFTVIAKIDDDNYEYGYGNNIKSAEKEAANKMIQTLTKELKQ